MELPKSEKLSARLSRREECALVVGALLDTPKTTGPRGEYLLTSMLELSRRTGLDPRLVGSRIRDLGGETLKAGGKGATRGRFHVIMAPEEIKEMLGRIPIDDALSRTFRRYVSEENQARIKEVLRMEGCSSSQEDLKRFAEENRRSFPVLRAVHVPGEGICVGTADDVRQYRRRRRIDRGGK